MVLSDLHPAAVTLGGAAFFQDAQGGAGVVHGFDHIHSDYLSGVFREAGLVVRQCLEPRFGPSDAAMQVASQFIPDAAAAAYVGVPGALIWDLVQTLIRDP